VLVPKVDHGDLDPRSDRCAPSLAR